MKPQLLIFRFIISVFFTLIFTQYISAKEKPKVLLISSYNSSFPTFFSQINGVKSILNDTLVALDVEFMDTKRFTDDENEIKFTNYLTYKLSHLQKYDAIITCDDNALNFALKLQDSLFKNIPIIFCGVNNIEKALNLNKNNNATGVIEAISMKETIGLMLNMFPNSTKIYAISDETSSGIADLATYYACKEDYKSVNFSEISLGNLSFSEFEKTLQKIPENTPVLLLSAYEDKNKVNIPFSESITKIKNNLKSPLFHLWEHGFNEGIIGGKIISHFDQGKQAAKITLQILNGTPISKIPVNNTSPNIYKFDYNQLIKYEIDSATLPKNRQIINEPTSFYSKQKTTIYTVFFIFSGLFILVILLFNNILKRKKSEKNLLIQNREFAALNTTHLKQNKQLKLAIQKNEETENKFKAITNQSVDSITLTNLEGKFIFVNPAFCKLTGYTEDELLNMTVYDVNFDKNTTIFKDVRNSMTGKSFHTYLLKKDGSKSKVDIISIIIVINNQSLYLGTIRDISEKEKIEKELLEAKEKAEQSNLLITEFIHNMSHEIRTPMNGILGFSNLLNNTNLTSEKRKLYSDIILNSGNQLLRIIDDILEISILGTKHIKVIEKEICLNNLLLEQFNVFGLKAKERKLPLYLTKGLSDIDSYIKTDETKLNKVISNLLENALKFTNVGFIEMGYKLKNKTIEIYIKDTGIGINPEKHEMIFNRFSQEEKNLSQNVGGLGLGLSIAKENIELLGGTISVKSEKGAGATFFITIPYKPVNTKKIINSTVEKIDITTILIAEDEEVNFLYLEEALNNYKTDLRILHAKNGKEAVDFCKKNESIDLIFMDIKMPVLNGFEATKLIREFNKNIPIIAQTAYTTKEYKHEAKKAGCTSFISKPVQKETLYTIINNYTQKIEL